MYKNNATFLWEVNMSKLTNFIDLELKRRRIQKKDLLEYVGVSRVAYSRWARGEAHPKLANMTLISEFLSIPLKDLISLDREGIPIEPETEKAAAPEDDGKEDSKLMSIARQLEQVSLRFALYGDPAEDVTESDLDAIREYARYIRDKKK
jgi:transcriptional regulator with XRE-family HTH domain